MLIVRDISYNGCIYSDKLKLWYAYRAKANQTLQQLLFIDDFLLELAATYAHAVHRKEDLRMQFYQ